MTGSIRSGSPRLPTTPSPNRSGHAPAGSSAEPRPGIKRARPLTSSPQAPAKPAVQDNSKVDVDQRLTAQGIDSVGHPYEIVLDTPERSAPLNFMGERPLDVMGHDVMMGTLGEYKLEADPTGTRTTTHQVGSTSKDLNKRLQFQRLGAGGTHTQSHESPGVHHQQVSGYASAARVSNEETHKKGNFNLKTMLNAAPFHAEGTAGVRLNTNKGQQQAIAYATGKSLSGAHGTVVGQVGNQHASAVGRVDIRGGAFLEGEAGVVMDRQRGDFFAQARVVSLAGLEARTQAQGQLGPFIAYGGLSAKAGLGYEFGVGAGMKDGVIKAQANMGAAFAAGGTSWVGVGFDTNYVRNQHEAHRQRKQERSLARENGEPRAHHLHMPDWARNHHSQPASPPPAAPSQQPTTTP